ncbi:hypothetical protein, partial [Curtobacterium sp. MCBA15_008]|uniref:hypothetical protein n=1 Tax=Curtobacterium sp. MCBA15_008 TaxID=1898736 RepID=UPI001C31738F
KEVPPERHFDLGVTGQTEACVGPEALWLIPRERTGGVVILGVEAIQRKARSELQWRMVPLEGRRALGFRSSRSAAPLG